MYLENIVAIFKCVIFIEAKGVQGYRQGRLNTDCYMIYEIYIVSRINDISNLENKFDANILWYRWS